MLTAIISDLDTHKAFQAAGLTEKQYHTRETPFGYSNYLHIFEHDGNSFVTLSRLGEGQEITTHPFVNYKAEIWAIKELRVKQIISVSAARPLNGEMVTRKMFIRLDVLEWKSTVPKKCFDPQQAREINPRHSFCPALRARAVKLIQLCEADPCHDSCHYDGETAGLEWWRKL